MTHDEALETFGICVGYLALWGEKHGPGDKLQRVVVIRKRGIEAKVSTMDRKTTWWVPWSALEFRPRADVRVVD